MTVSLRLTQTLMMKLIDNTRRICNTISVNTTRSNTIMPSPISFNIRPSTGNDIADRKVQFDALIDFAWEGMSKGLGNHIWVFSATYLGVNALGLVFAKDEDDARALLSKNTRISKALLPTDVPNDGYPVQCLSSGMERGHMFNALATLSYYLPVYNEAAA